MCFSKTYDQSKIDYGIKILMDEISENISTLRDEGMVVFPRLSRNVFDEPYILDILVDVEKRVKNEHNIAVYVRREDACGTAFDQNVYSQIVVMKLIK